MLFSSFPFSNTKKTCAGGDYLSANTNFFLFYLLEYYAIFLYSFLSWKIELDVRGLSWKIELDVHGFYSCSSLFQIANEKNPLLDSIQLHLHYIVTHSHLWHFSCDSRQFQFKMHFVLLYFFYFISEVIVFDGFHLSDDLVLRIMCRVLYIIKYQ